MLEEAQSSGESCPGLFGKTPTSIRDEHQLVHLKNLRSTTYLRYTLPNIEISQTTKKYGMPYKATLTLIDRQR